jgi:ethanolamine ammonia-lyase large subunit
LRTYFLEEDENHVKNICQGLNSDVIACVIRMMSIDELRKVGSKIFNPVKGK